MLKHALTAGKSLTHLGRSGRACAGHFLNAAFRPAGNLPLLAIVLLLALAHRGKSASAAGPPNVLLIMTDDQGWGDIHSHGNELLDTPVLDQLAADGARFERFFVSPVCAPTRASLLTGRYHLRTGVHGVTRAYETMRAEEVTLAEIFRAAGYSTACFGKWHNGAHYPHHPNGQGFREFLGFCAGHWNNYFDPQLEFNARPVPARGYITDVFTKAAMHFIERQAGQPFFCYLALNAPHSPFQVPDQFFDKYKARGLDDTLACVYGMCENIDQNIGRVLAKLNERALTENTIVIFLTDNGPNTARYNGDMKGRKAGVDEGSVRVPLFVRWPGKIHPGTRITQIASHIDILPTLVELTGIEAPKTLPLDGISLAPLLRGENESWPERLIYTHQSTKGQVLPNKGSVRSQQHRAVYKGRDWSLYDIEADPGQKHNLAEEQPETLTKLQQAYLDWFADVTKAGFDSIPTEIGHLRQPNVMLPGHEATLHPAPGEGISYFGKSGWANDWITNWTSTEAYPSWDIEIVESWRYRISLLYSCPASQIGSTVRVVVGDRSLERKMTQPFEASPLPDHDRVDRGETHDRRWSILPMGIMELPAGRHRLEVHAPRIAHEQPLDLKAVLVELALPELPVPGGGERGVSYCGVDDDRRKLDVYTPSQPDGPLPLIVWVHGGAWKSGSSLKAPLHLTRHGYVVASINYRYSTQAPFPAQLEDCKAAIRFLRAHAHRYKIDPERVGVWGSSAGGHLAALLGTTGDVPEFDVGCGTEKQSSRVQAVCDFFGPTDFLQMDAHAAPNSPESQLIGGPIQRHPEKVARANPITYVSADDPPFLIVHGDQDPVVPIHQSQLLDEALQAAKVSVTFHTVEGAGHGFGDREDVRKQVLEFFDKHLKPAAQ